MSINDKRLGDIATYINGYAFKPKDWGTKGLPIIRIQNLTGSSKEINFYDGDIDEKYIVRKGDILIAWSASLGVHEWNGEKALLNQHIFKVVFDKEKINKNFFKFMVQKVLERTQKYLHGSTMKHITKKYFDNLLIPFPPLEIQEKIAGTLLLAESLVNKRKAQIEALDQLTQSVFLEMFGDIATNSKGWEYKKLSDICKNLDSKRVPITSSERKKGIYPYYGASGIVDYVNDYIFDGNYLLVSEDGANLLARVTPIAFEVEGKIWVNNHAHVLKFDNLSTQCFIKYVINLQDISHLITGSAQPKLNQKNLNSFMVPVPPLKLQNEFYEKVKLIEEKRKIFHSSLLELERLFNALLQKVFKGELIFEEKVLNL